MRENRISFFYRFFKKDALLVLHACRLDVGIVAAVLRFEVPVRVLIASQERGRHSLHAWLLEHVNGAVGRCEQNKHDAATEGCGIVRFVPVVHVSRREDGVQAAEKHILAVEDLEQGRSRGGDEHEREAQNEDAHEGVLDGPGSWFGQPHCTHDQRRQRHRLHQYE